MATAQLPRLWEEALQNCRFVCRNAPSKLIGLEEFLMILHTHCGWTWGDVVSLRSLVAPEMTNVQRRNEPGGPGLSR
jgi:hypothetical protein